MANWKARTAAALQPVVLAVVASSVGPVGPLGPQKAYAQTTCTATTNPTNGTITLSNCNGPLPISHNSSFDANMVAALRAARTVYEMGRSHTIELRDQLQDRTDRGSQPRAYAEESDPSFESRWQALGYAGGPVLGKAPPPKKPAVEDNIEFAAWTNGKVGYEQQTGIDKAVSLGAAGGVDVTINKITSADDSITLGVNSGTSLTNIRNPDGTTGIYTGPSFGFTAIYVNGGFSVDGAFSTTFLGLNDIANGVGQFTNATNYTTGVNISEKFDVAKNWWVEPTVGASYTATDWSADSIAVGANDGNATRVEGGVRVGTKFDLSDIIRVKATWGVTVFSDVSINGFNCTATISCGVGGANAAATQQGLVYGSVNTKYKFDFGDGWDVGVKAEVTGFNGLFAVAGTLTIDYAFAYNK